MMRLARLSVALAPCSFSVFRALKSWLSLRKGKGSPGLSEVWIVRKGGTVLQGTGCLLAA